MAAYVGDLRSRPEPEGFDEKLSFDVHDLTKPNAPVWHFLSNFLYADFILNNTINTPSARFPINIILEYENNLNAADHPFDTSARSGCTQDPVTLIVTCTTSQPAVNTSLGKQSHAYLIDASLGQQKNKGDLQFGYAWLRQEQDSVIACSMKATSEPQRISCSTASTPVQTIRGRGQRGPHSGRAKQHSNDKQKQKCLVVRSLLVRTT
jgi:hypothetical protein